MDVPFTCSEESNCLTKPSKNSTCADDKYRLKSSMLNSYEEASNESCKNFRISWTEPPVEIHEENTTEIDLPLLVWHGYDVIPKILSVCNTSRTITVNGNWNNGRPYIEGGPLNGKYMFSEIHFHCPSEHEVDGRRFPLEMHVVHYKTSYLTQERAMNEKDGTLVLVYLFQVTDSKHTVLSEISKMSNSLAKINTRIEINKIPLSALVKPFFCNYYVYWGSVTMKRTSYILQWIINNNHSKVTKQEVDALLSVMNTYTAMASKGPKMKPQNSIIYKVGENFSLPSQIVARCPTVTVETNTSRQFNFNNCSSPGFGAPSQPRVNFRDQATTCTETLPCPPQCQMPQQCQTQPMVQSQQCQTQPMQQPCQTQLPQLPQCQMGPPLPPPLPLPPPPPRSIRFPEGEQPLSQQGETLSPRPPTPPKKSQHQYDTQQIPQQGQPYYSIPGYSPQNCLIPPPPNGSPNEIRCPHQPDSPPAQCMPPQPQYAYAPPNLCSNCGGIDVDAFIPKHTCKCKRSLRKICSTCGGSKSTESWGKRKWNQDPSSSIYKSSSHSSSDSVAKPPRRRRSAKKKSSYQKKQSESSENDKISDGEISTVTTDRKLIQKEKLIEAARKLCRPMSSPNKVCVTKKCPRKVCKTVCKKKPDSWSTVKVIEKVSDSCECQQEESDESCERLCETPGEGSYEAPNELICDDDDDDFREEKIREEIPNGVRPESPRTVWREAPREIRREIPPERPYNSRCEVPREEPRNVQCETPHGIVFENPCVPRRETPREIICDDYGSACKTPCPPPCPVPVETPYNPVCRISRQPPVKCSPQYDCNVPRQCSTTTCTSKCHIRTKLCQRAKQKRKNCIIKSKIRPTVIQAPTKTMIEDFDEVLECVEARPRAKDCPPLRKKIFLRFRRNKDIRDLPEKCSVKDKRRDMEDIFCERSRDERERWEELCDELMLEKYGRRERKSSDRREELPIGRKRSRSRERRESKSRDRRRSRSHSRDYSSSEDRDYKSSDRRKGKKDKRKSRRGDRKDDKSVDKKDSKESDNREDKESKKKENKADEKTEEAVEKVTEEKPEKQPNENKEEKRSSKSNEVTTLFVKTTQNNQWDILLPPTNIDSDISDWDAMASDYKKDSEEEVPKKELKVEEQKKQKELEISNITPIELKESNTSNSSKPNELCFQMKHSFQSVAGESNKLESDNISQEYHVTILYNSNILQEYKGNFQPSDLSLGECEKLNLVPKYQKPDNVQVNLQECIIKKQALDKFFIDSKFLVKGWDAEEVFTSLKKEQEDTIISKQLNFLDTETQYSSEEVELTTILSPETKSEFVQTDLAYFTLGQKIKRILCKKLNVKSGCMQTEPQKFENIKDFFKCSTGLMQTSSNPELSTLTTKYGPYHLLNLLEASIPSFKSSNRSVIGKNPSEKLECKIKLIRNSNRSMGSYDSCLSSHFGHAKSNGKTDENNTNTVYFMYDKIEKDPTTGKKIFMGKFRTKDDLKIMRAHKIASRFDGASSREMTNTSTRTSLNRVRSSAQSSIGEAKERKNYNNNLMISSVAKWLQEDGKNFELLAEILGIDKNKIPKRSPGETRAEESSNRTNYFFEDKATTCSSLNMTPSDPQDIVNLEKINNEESVIVVPVEAESWSKIEVVLIDHSNDKKSIKMTKKYIP